MFLVVPGALLAGKAALDIRQSALAASRIEVLIMIFSLIAEMG
jgi:hypothetical protein